MIYTQKSRINFLKIIFITASCFQVFNVWWRNKKVVFKIKISLENFPDFVNIDVASLTTWDCGSKNGTERYACTYIRGELKQKQKTKFMA